MRLIKGLLPAPTKEKAHTLAGILLSFASGALIGFILWILYSPGENQEPPMVKESSFSILKNGPEYITYRIQKGDSLYKIFNKIGAPLKAITLIDTVKKLNFIKCLKPGVEIKIEIDPQKKDVKRLEYPLALDTLLILNNTPQGIIISRKEIDYETRLSLVGGKIKTSFFEDALEAGLTSQLVQDLVNIFEWDIDFSVDIREGDSFRVLLEDKYKDGKFAYTKRVLAAKFINHGREYQIFYFKDPEGNEGYYDSSGRSVRKEFLKSPLSYNCITSGFTSLRLHPILKIYRPHYGVDYAAPLGTPVKAVASGIITSAGWEGEFGNSITIQHNSIYTSHYGHLLRFAPGVKPGLRVKQGEIIGYVGASGLATGPHLDFRLLEKGTYINPLNIKNISREGVNPKYLSRFKVIMNEMVARLEGQEKRGIFVAQNSPLLF